MSITMKGGVSYAELMAFCDGALSVEETARVAECLEKDKTLREQMDQILRGNSALRDSAGAGTPGAGVAYLAQTLEGRLEAERNRRTLRSVAILAACAVVLVIFGWFAHAQLTNTAVAPGSAPSFVADAISAHETFAYDSIHPVEFTDAEKPVLQRWFAIHFGPAAYIPNLTSVGFDLLGGRLLTMAAGKSAHLLYENAAGDRVSIVFSARGDLSGDELRLTRVRNIHASYWQQSGLTWAVLENTPGADIASVANYVADRVELGSRP